jgi:putative ABC transport system permease protein
MSGVPDPSDIEREIAFHLQETVDMLVQSGMDEHAARQEAERRYGDRRRHASAMRAAHIQVLPLRTRLAAFWTDVVTEVRFAARGLLRARGYTIAVVATLALASGANLTVFGIMDGLTYRPLKYLRAPHEVHRVYWQWTDNGQRTTSASTQYTRFVDFTREARTFAEVAVFAERSLPVGDHDAAQQRPVAAVSASYFRFFDAHPERGRFFSAAEDVTPRGADVVVLGYGYWRANFGGRDVLGQVLRVGEIRATIVGVAPEGFDGLNDGRPPAAFVPITTYAASTGTTDSRTYFSAYKWGWVHLLVRRAKGIDLVTATADATRIFKDTWPKFLADNSNLPSADAAEPRVVLSGVRTGAGPTAGREARTAFWLFGVAGAVLLIGCGNVANFSLSRSLARRREIGVKLALGISARRLTIGVYAEAALLALGGGIAALAVAQWTRAALAPVLRSLRLAELSVFTDRRTLLVTAVLVVFSAALTGWLPSLFLRKGALTAVQGRPRGATSEWQRARGLLLVAQAMLSVTLLVGAGLFVRSLIAVRWSSLGYDPSRVLVVNRFIPPGRFDDLEQATLRAQLLQAATALPAVESAAWMSSAPFVSTSWTDVHVAGLSNTKALGPFTFQATTADYFKTMGTRIVRGRGLREDDTIGAPAVAVVSESMARTLWPGRDALGECFKMRTLDSPCRVIVGIAEDIVQRELAEGPRLHYYVPIDQYPRTYGNGLLIKLRDAPTRAGEDVRLALQQVLPAAYYLVAQPLSDVVVDQQASWRMGASVLVAYGALALVVAGVGLFGSVSYDIAQRSREWAVRVALGADTRAIVALIMGRSLTVVLIGVVPGLLMAAAFGRWIQPLLYRTSALDPASFAMAAVLMFLVAIAASTWPALRAARTHPGSALRSE